MTIHMGRRKEGSSLSGVAEVVEMKARNGATFFLGILECVELPFSRWDLICALFACTTENKVIAIKLGKGT